MLIPCCVGRIAEANLPLAALSASFGSTLPAVWSFMLAARERGLGTCWTTLHLNYEQEIAQLLGIPDDISQLALIPIAYTKGTDFKQAPRKPLDGVLHTNSW
jgi:nitroreductase